MKLYILLSDGSINNMSIKILLKSGWFVGVEMLFGPSVIFVGRNVILQESKKMVKGMRG